MSERLFPGVFCLGGAALLAVASYLAIQTGQQGWVLGGLVGFGAAALLVIGLRYLVRVVQGVPAPTEGLGLGTGEHVLRRWSGNHLQGRHRAVGGHLYLTSRRLVFRPHLVDHALGGRPVEITHAAIERVTVEPVRLHSWRRSRLVVVPAGGVAGEVFTVRNPAKAAEEVNRVARR
jgi:hypothetical protein